MRSGVTIDDLLNPGSGDNSIDGGFGSDTFAFNASIVNATHIYAFESWDRIQLVDFGYADAAAAQSHLSQATADTVVFSDQGTTITFHGATLAELQSAVWILS